MLIKTKKIFLVFALGILIPLQSHGEDLTWTNTSVPDTIYFALKTEMIKEAKIEKRHIDTQYRIIVELKEQYHKQYEKATQNSISKLFAITYQGDIILPNLPMIHTRIRSGRFTIEPFKKRSKAEELRDRILNKN